jgi:vancomycin resistance protein VanW
LADKALLCKRHPVFYHASVWEKRVRKKLQWVFTASESSRQRAGEKLAHRVKIHQSALIRKLGTSDPRLQVNKITNLNIATQRINGVLIMPGETFSFWRLVGLPTRYKGYLEGMLLARGEVLVGVGGGLCQLSNLLHWLALHTPLTITERHHHGFDPFPDDGRVLPFGSGATVFYNYIDLQFRNDTEHTFQILVGVTDKHLKGEIWKRVIDRKTGDTVREELVTENFAEVRYVPASWMEN